jgi:hypothetical protein
MSMLVVVIHEELIGEDPGVLDAPVATRKRRAVL